MDLIWDNISTSFVGMLGWELVAVVLAIAYLWLAMRQNQWCWPAAFVSTLIYTVLFWNVSLLMDSALNVYYMGMAVFGWWSWSQGADQGEAVRIHRWPVRWHVYAIGGILMATVVSGTLLEANTEAAWPYADSFTTWASVFTTFLVARKVLENWLYWIVIDSVALMLYIERGLYLTAILFMFYLVLCVIGYRRWKAEEPRLAYA